MKNRNPKTRLALLCTGILMLVLSVLPHHHHCDGSIRFSVPERCEECSHETDADHRHTEGEHCDLRDLFVLVTRDDSALCHLFDQLQIGEVPFVTLFTALLPDATYCPETTLTSLYHLRYGERFILPLNPYLDGASPLRAPPAFIA